MSEIDYDWLWKQYAKYTKAYIFDRFKESNQSFILELQAHLQTKKELEELQDAIVQHIVHENGTDLTVELASYLDKKDFDTVTKHIEASRKRNKP